MIADPEDLLEGWAFVARRNGLEGQASATAVRSGVEQARALAAQTDDEPAALFYAFASRPRAFAGGWRFMPAP